MGGLFWAFISPLGTPRGCRVTVDGAGVVSLAKDDAIRKQLVRSWGSTRILALLLGT